MEDDAAGAMTVELAPLPAAVRIDSPEVALGPEQQEAKLAPEATKEVVEEVEEDIPPVPPSPAPEPELTLPKPQPEKETPEEKKPQEAVPESQKPSERRSSGSPRPHPASKPSRRPCLAVSRVALNRLTPAQWHQGRKTPAGTRHRRYPEAARLRGQQGRSLCASRSIDRDAYHLFRHIEGIREAASGRGCIRLAQARQPLSGASRSAPSVGTRTENTDGLHSRVIRGRTRRQVGLAQSA